MKQRLIFSLGAMLALTIGCDNATRTAETIETKAHFIVALAEQTTRYFGGVVNENMNDFTTATIPHLLRVKRKLR